MGEELDTEIRLPRFFAVDFFCGAGGTTCGLIQAEGYVVAGIDKNPECRETYVRNNRNRTLDCAAPLYLDRDVLPRTQDYPDGQHDCLLDDLAELVGSRKRDYPDIPWLFAVCAPCQPFTRLSRGRLSAKRQERRRREAQLLRWVLPIIERFRPELLFCENVPGIMRVGGPDGIWTTFEEQLRELGYVVGSKVVCASRFGVPQFRKRSILLGVAQERVREERFADLSGSALLVPESDPDAPLITVREAIGHLPPLQAGEAHPEIPNHRARALSDLNKRRLMVLRPGEPNSRLENTRFGDLSLPCHRKVNERLKDRCFNDVYTRMRPDRPAPTITTRCHSISNGRFGHYDPRQVRGITPREAALLQSFPEDYVFYPEHMFEPAARMIGNAVPPKLAAFFAEYLVKSLKTERPSAAEERIRCRSTARRPLIFC